MQLFRVKSRVKSRLFHNILRFYPFPPLINTMLRFAGRLRGPYRQVPSYSNALLRETHSATRSLHGNEVMALARDHQQTMLLCRRASRQDGVLTATMGLVAGGLLFTSIADRRGKDEWFHSVTTSLYQDALDVLYSGNGRRQRDATVIYFLRNQT